MNEKLVSDYSSKSYRRPKAFKIIIIGESNVGKTSLSFRFCEGRFPEKAESTIGVDFRERKITIGANEINLQLWDTAGQERFRRSMVPHYYRNADAAVFVYDVTRISSLMVLPSFVSECQRLCGSDLPSILVGNKCDLSSDVQVSTQSAQEFADQYNMPVFETSAKQDSYCDHVESIFLTLGLKLANNDTRQNPVHIPSPKNCEDGLVVLNENQRTEEEEYYTCC